MCTVVRWPSTWEDIAEFYSAPRGYLLTLKDIKRQPSFCARWAKKHHNVRGYWIREPSDVLLPGTSTQGLKLVSLISGCVIELVKRQDTPGPARALSLYTGWTARVARNHYTGQLIGDSLRLATGHSNENSLRQWGKAWLV